MSVYPSFFAYFCCRRVCVHGTIILFRLCRYVSLWIYVLASLFLPLGFCLFDSAYVHAASFCFLVFVLVLLGHAVGWYQQLLSCYVYFSFELFLCLCNILLVVIHPVFFCLYSRVIAARSQGLMPAVYVASGNPSRCKPALVWRCLAVYPSFHGLWSHYHVGNIREPRSYRSIVEITCHRHCLNSHSNYLPFFFL